MKKILDFRVIITLLILLLGYYVVTQTLNRTEEEKEEILLPVTVIDPHYGSLQKTYTLNGYLESNDVVTVLPKVSGNLQTLNFDVGDYVTKDQIIGTVDSEQLKLNTSQAETAYRTSKDTFDRQTLLFNSNATSKQNYEQAKSAYEANKAQYDLAMLQLSYADVKAPISGTILQVQATEGSLVSAGTPVVTIGTIDNLIMRVNVPEKYYEYFYLQDQEMNIELSRPDYKYQTYKVNIRYISPVINPQSMSFEVVCHFEKAPEMLRPGMFMKAEFVLDEANDIYYLPATTIKNNMVWYVDQETSTAHQLEINQGFTTDDYIEIPAEYKDYKFINEGFYFLKENQKVNVLEVTN